MIISVICGKIVDENDLPLLDLFTKLREAGLQLGIDEYQLAMHAMQAGFGIRNRDALKRLCQTLWVKSKEERQLFEYHFEQVMASEARLPAPETLSTPSRLLKIYLIAIGGILLILSVGIILVVNTSSKKQTQVKVSQTPTIISPTASVIATETATLIPTPTQTPQSNTSRNQPNLIFGLCYRLSPLVVGMLFLNG